MSSSAVGPRRDQVVAEAFALSREAQSAGLVVTRLAPHRCGDEYEFAVSLYQPDGRLWNDATHESAGSVRESIGRWRQRGAPADAARVQPAVSGPLERVGAVRAALDGDEDLVAVVDQVADMLEGDPFQEGRHGLALLERLEAFVARRRPAAVGESALRSWAERGMFFGLPVRSVRFASPRVATLPVDAVSPLGPEWKLSWPTVADEPDAMFALQRGELSEGFVAWPGLESLPYAAVVIDAYVGEAGPVLRMPRCRLVLPKVGVFGGDEDGTAARWLWTQPAERYEP